MKTVSRFILFTLLFINNLCLAQGYQGYDVLALAKFCDTYLKAPRLPAVSVLMNTFGDPLPCIDKAAARGGLKLVQVDLIDATCWRNKVCPSGVPKPDDLKTIEARARLVSKLAVKYPQIKFELSPALEHDVKDAKRVKLMMSAAKKGCPTCQIINSPLTGAKVPPLELHGTKVRAFSVSGDGASSLDGDNKRSDGNKFEHRTSGSQATYMWINEFNLRCTGEKSFTPPLRRTNRPTIDLFEQAYLVAQPEPNSPNLPPSCSSVVGFARGEINKPNAEAYCNGQPPDKRGNKNLLILKRKGKSGEKLKILNNRGQEVGCFKYYGTFDSPGLFRWYQGDCSGHTPAKLFKLLGNEWGFIPLGGGKCLKFNSVRREGTYR